MSYMQEANAIAARLRPGRMPSYSGPHKRTTASPRALEVLAYMRSFFAENDQLPPVAQITRAFGWVGDNAAHHHVVQLLAFGYLERNAVGRFRFARTKGMTQ